MSTQEQTTDTSQRGPSAPHGRPDVELPAQAPPQDAQPGPSGVPLMFAIVAMFVFVGVVFLLLGVVRGWVGLGVAIIVMLLGVFAVSRYVQRIAWTRSSPELLRRGLAGMNEDLANSDERHTELSPHDFPQDNPARRVLEQQQG